MEQLLLLLSPFVVALLTSGVKKIGASNILSNGSRKPILRFVVALFSFLSVVGSSVLSGGEVDPMDIQSFADALLVFLGSTGVYFFAKK